MTRAERLLAILQLLRTRRHPVTAADLARHFHVVERTVYRDIASLIGQGSRIESCPGLGYELRAGYFLPPLAFSSDEAAALMLGLRFVERRGDPALVAAAAAARAKLQAVCSAGFDHEASLAAPLLIGPGPGVSATILESVRKALTAQRKIRIGYVDREGQRSERVVWPVALGWFEHVEILAAWCESKSAFRSFRIDRIVRVDMLQERPSRSRGQLLSDYKKIEPGILL